MTLHGAQVALKGGYAHFSTARFPNFVFIQTALYSDLKGRQQLEEEQAEFVPFATKERKPMSRSGTGLGRYMFLR